MLPLVTNSAELRAAVADASVWRDAIATVVARHGLNSVAPICLAGGSFAVFFLGRDLVIKFVPNRYRAQYDAELVMMTYLQERLPLATPELLFAGEIDSWGYMVSTRLSGELLSVGFEHPSHDNRCDIMRAIGKTMAAMHSLPVRGLESIALDWDAFVSAQRATCVERHRRSGAPEMWLATIPGWLDATAVVAPSPLVAMTADLHGDAFLVTRENHDIVLSGLIDFGDSLVGDPLYDFVTPVTFLVRGRAPLLDALLTGYGISREARTPTLRRQLMAYSLLHRFAALKRDVAMLASPFTCDTLDAALNALWPFDEGDA